MRYAVIVMLETERTPQNIIDEIVSVLEFEPSTQTTIASIVVLLDDSTEVAIYEKEQK